MISLLYERRRHGMAEVAGWGGHWLTGPWPLLAGALALAAVNIATLLASGIPWGITSAFALWGAKIAQSVGVNVAAWPYWQGQQALTQSVFADRTSLMDFALMLGALAASGLAGKFSPQARLPLLSLLAAILGGLLMGYGARLATAAISVPSSPALPRAACMASSGCSLPFPAMPLACGCVPLRP